MHRMTRQELGQIAYQAWFHDAVVDVDPFFHANLDYQDRFIRVAEAVREAVLRREAGPALIESLDVIRNEMTAVFDQAAAELKEIIEVS